MDGLQWKTLKWMIWGYHYFRKHPYNRSLINQPGFMQRFCVFFRG